MLFNKTIIAGPLYLTNQLVSRLALQLLGEYFPPKKEKEKKGENRKASKKRESLNSTYYKAQKKVHSSRVDVRSSKLTRLV